MWCVLHFWLFVCYVGLLALISFALCVVVCSG